MHRNYWAKCRDIDTGELRDYQLRHYGSNNNVMYLVCSGDKKFYRLDSREAFLKYYEDASESDHLKRIVNGG